MKVAFFYGNLLRGGAQRVMCVLANKFVEWGDEAILLTLDDGKSGYYLDPRVKVCGLKVAGDSKNKLQSAERLIKTLTALRRWHREERPDVVVCFSMFLNLQLVTALTGTSDKCKIITSERANPNVRKANLIFKMEMRALEKDDGFIFQTERVSRLFSQKLREKGRVIHNGLFSEEIPEKVIDFSNRDMKKICAVGRIDEQKAYDVMLNAFAIFHSTHWEYILNIYGDGKDEEATKVLTEKLGLGQNVIFHGNRPDAVNLIKDAGMFVMTSRYEGMPNALLEAMACGIPCVCTDCDFGPAELIEDGVSGLLVPVDDAEAVAAAMTRIADEPGLAERLSGGAARIRETHSREEICRQYRDYIEKIVNK